MSESATSGMDQVLQPPRRKKSPTRLVGEQVWSVLKEIKTKTVELKLEMALHGQQLKRLDDREEELREEVNAGYEARKRLLEEEEEANRAVERAQRAREEELQMEEEVRRLREEYAALRETTEKRRRQVEEHVKFRDIMDQMLRMSKYEDVEQLSNCSQSINHLRKDFTRQDAESERQLNEEKKAQTALRNQHQLEQVQGNNQIYTLQSELEKVLAEGVTLETFWNNIQSMAAKKTLTLGNIKMAAWNMYELTGGKEDGEEELDRDDTEKLLDHVKKFLKDYEKFLKQHQTAEKEKKSHK